MRLPVQTAAPPLPGGLVLGVSRTALLRSYKLAKNLGKAFVSHSKHPPVRVNMQ